MGYGPLSEDGFKELVKTATQEAVQEKVNTDKVFKKVYDVYGNVIETDYKEVIINIYTKLNNSVIGFDIQEDGFRKIYVYKNEKNFFLTISLFLILVKLVITSKPLYLWFPMSGTHFS